MIPLVSPESPISASAISTGKTAPAGAKPDLEVLEARSSRFESLATACGGVVALGCVLEYAPVFLNLLPHWSWHAFARELLGGVLIALGVFFEVLFGMFGSRLQSRIGAMKDAIIAELNLKAEQERHQRVKLQMSMAGRQITARQIEILKKALCRFRGQTVYVIGATDDFEVVKFSAILWNALASCEWDARPEDAKPPARIPAPGLHIFSSTENDSQRAAAALDEALMAIGIACATHTQSAESRADDDRRYKRYFPPALHVSGEPLVLVVVNEAPLVQYPDAEVFA
jgi:hypothetical protein